MHPNQGAESNMLDLIVIGAGPAGVVAALRAGDLGAKTALVTRDQFGGMAANDGPVPVRTLAHAARLIRDARQLRRYGIEICEPVLNYERLLERVREVTADVRAHSAFRKNLFDAEVAVYEQSGTVHFVDPHTIATTSGLQLEGKRIIVCTGGASRKLDVPGFELTATHSDAWKLNSVPPIDAGDRRRGDGRPGGIDVQRVRFQSSALSGRAANSST